MSSSAPPRTKRDVVSEFREAEIIGAARRVIARDGPRQASMEKIAEEAGISKGTLYLYFDSKEDLIREATERGHSEMAAYVDQEVQAADGPVKAIEAYIAATLQFCDENETLFRAMNTYPDSGGDPSANAVVKRIDDYVDLLENFIERGVSDGLLRQVHARRVARVIVEAVRGVVIERLRDAEGKAMDVETKAAGLHLGFLEEVGLIAMRIALADTAARNGAHEAEVGRGQVIAVEAIVELELPVGLEGVLRGAGNGLHSVRPLLHRKVEEEAGVAQELFERRHVFGQCAKQQPFVIGKRRKFDQAVIVFVKGGMITAKLLILDVDVLAG